MSNTKSFPFGDTVKLTVTIRVDGDLTAATVVTTMEDPDGLDIEPTGANPSTGVYTETHLTANIGYYRYKVVISGAVTAVREGTFYVYTSRSPAGDPGG